MPPIRHAVTADGVRIAYFTLGSGPPCVVLFAYHVNHLELNWQVALHRRGLQFLAERFTVVALDLRGSGLSQRAVGRLSLQAFSRDIEAVLEALGLEQAAICAMGPSALMAFHFAKRFPARVARIVCLQAGESATNKQLLRLRALNADVEARLRGVVIGGDDSANAAALTAAARESLDLDTVRRWERLLSATNVETLASGVMAPTLLLHAINDAVIPASAGEALARGMANARFVPVAEGHPMQIWRSREALSLMTEWIAAGFGINLPKRRRARSKRSDGDGAAVGLTEREIAVLRLLVSGKTNRQIAAALFISTNTVSHHLRSIFAKTGAVNRTEASAFAHAHGLCPPSAE